MGTRGLTFVEVMFTIVIMGVLMAGGAAVLGRYGADGRLSYEANRLADQIWELRAQATMGQQYPCLDFPDSLTVRVYNDINGSTNGFTSGTDPIRSTHTYGGGIKARPISGGGSPNHYLCYDSRGVKTGTSILKVTLRGKSGNPVTVQVNPAVGSPRVIK